MTSAVPARRTPKIAMVVSRFPKVTETFQLREMLTLEKMGVDLELYAIVHMPDEGLQDDTASLDRRANYLRFASFEVLRAQLVWLRRNRSAYLRAWKWGIWTHRRAPDFLIRTFMLVPLAAAMALRMEAQGVEHVHAHYATYPTHIAMVIAQLTGLSYSFTGHAHDLRLRVDGLRDKMDGAEFYFCCTEFSAEDLRQQFGAVAEKGIVVHHGVDLEKFAFTPIPDRDDDQLRLVMVASFEECKGHAYLIKAVQILADRGVDTNVTLVGGNLANGHDYQSEMRELARELGVEDRFDFVGKQPSHEVQRLIAESDMGCLPCCRTAAGNMDGLPNFLTECLAVGRPVVSTDLPGVQELVTSGVQGLLVRSRDEVALADALEELHRDRPRREQMSLAGRAHVEHHENLAVNTAVLYQTYLDRVGRPLGIDTQPPPPHSNV